MSEERLQEALRESLRREDAPPDFAAKILAKTAGTAPGPMAPVAKLFIVAKRPVTLALAAALAGLAIIPAVMVEQRHREEARGLKAKQDLMTALAITRAEFRETRERLRRATGNTE